METRRRPPLPYHGPMPTSRPLPAYLTVVTLAAALDAVIVRQRHIHWPVEAGLFGELWLLWALLVLGAVPFAILVRKAKRDEVAFGPLLLAFVAAPFAAHATLRANSSLGASLGDVLQPAPLALAACAVAAALLAAWVVGRLAARLGDHTPRLQAALVLGAVLTGLFMPPRTTWTGAPEQGGEARPNVVLLVLDTVRARSMEAFGGDRTTSPYLTELASSGTRFTNARSVSCFTFTSHLSMLTGVYPSEHGARLLDMRYKPDAAPHVAEAFNRAGYRTGAFVGTNVLAGSTGIDHGFETYDDQVDPRLTYGFGWSLVHDLQSTAASLVPALNFNGRPHWIQDFQRPADDVLARAGAWLAADDGRPSFCMINLYDVHWPYLPEARFAEALVEPYAGPVDGFGDRSSSLPADHVFDAADDAYLTQLYEAELLELDERLERFLGALDLDRTALLITSDHGEAFGEGGRYEHDDVLEPQVEIPFVVRPAGGTPGRVSAAPVSGVDVAPTLLGLAGLEPDAAHRGLDLTQADPPAMRVRLIEDRDHLDPTRYRFAIYQGDYKLVQAQGPAQGAGLFDVRRDRIGIDDVSDSFPELAAALTELLAAERAKWGADAERDAAEAAANPGSTVEGLGDLGYLGD